MKKFAIALSMILFGGGMLPIVANGQNENPNQQVVTEQNNGEQVAKEGEARAARGERAGKNGDFKMKEGKGQRNGDKKSMSKCDGKSKCDKASKCDKGGKADRKGGKKGGRNLFAGIELTPEQQAQLTQLKEKGKQNIEKVEQEARVKKDKLREDFDKDVKKILTPEQYAKYEQNKADRQNAKKDKADKGGKKHDGKKGHKDGKKVQKDGKNRDSQK